MTNTTTNTMKTELKGKYDALDFVINPDNTKYETLLGDDTDTLVGCSYLREVAGIEIGGFYDFDNIYLNEGSKNGKKFIGIDMSLIQDGHRCWDNHIQLGSKTDVGNSACANINSFYGINASTKTEYHKKYAGSTALQMYAYYDGSKPKTIEGALLWLAIDSGFKGHYNNYFKGVHNGYLEDLGLTWAIDALSRYTYQEMVNFLAVNGLNSKIKLNNQGYLYNVGKWQRSSTNYADWFQGKSLNRKFVEEHLGFSIELPNEPFYLHTELERVSVKTSEVDYNTLDKKEILSMAYTYTDQIEMTKYK